MIYNILIVDDSKLARMAVVKALKDQFPDWGRFEAANADEALEAVKSSAVHIALLDFNMPGGDGLTLAADLRQMNAAMPLAIISANHQNEVVQRARALGAAFLAKPLTEDALREFLAAAMQQLKAAAK